MKTRDELIDVLIGTIITGFEWGDIVAETKSALLEIVSRIIETTEHPFSIEEYKKVAFEYVVNSILADENTPEDIKSMVRETIALEEKLAEICNKLTGKEEKKDIWSDALDNLGDKCG